MGLDQYLYVSKTFSGETADNIKRILGQSDAKDGHCSISMWQWTEQNQAEDFAIAKNVLFEAGMLSLVDQCSPTGVVSIDGDQVTVNVVTAYWRKANAVHGWFVRNVQDGVDECQLSNVDVEQLAKLAYDCQSALDAWGKRDYVLASEIMPPMSGFFFGGYELDDYWAAGLVYAMERLEFVVRQSIWLKGMSFAYQASW